MITQLVQRVYNALINSGNITYVVFPAAAVSVTAPAGAGGWANGAYIEIVATVGAADVWLTSVSFENPALVTQMEVDISTGAAFAVVRATLPVVDASYTLPFPLRIVAGTRVGARNRAVAALATIDVKIGCAVGV